MEVQARRIAGRASYLASFTLHDEFKVERTEGDEELPVEDFGLQLDDPAGSSYETGAYAGMRPRWATSPLRRIQRRPTPVHRPRMAWTSRCKLMPAQQPRRSQRA